MASLSCASILCAVVLLITNGSIRHAVFVADFRGGFPWRISVADFQWRILRRISVADFRGGFSVADFRGGFAWRILRSGFPWRICLADFAADFVFFLAADLRRILVNHAADFCGGFVQVQNPVNYTSKSHPPQKSTAFFTACSPSM